MKSLTAAQLQAVISSLAEAISITRADGELVYINDAAARLFGYGSAEETLAIPLAQMYADFELLDEDGAPFDLSRLPGRRVLEGIDAEPVTMLRRHRTTGEERWLTIKATAISDDAGTPTHAVNLIEDVTEERRAREKAAFLAEASALLASSLDFTRTMQAVADAAVPQIADWCAVELLDHEGSVEQVALAAVDQSKLPLVAELRERYPTDPDSETGSPAVRRTGVSQLFSDIDPALVEQAAVDEEHLELLRSLEMTSALIVPLRTPDTVLGTITFLATGGRRRLTETDLDLGEELGRRAGVAVQNARIHQERSEIAATLQRSLLPPRLPVVPGVTLAARFRAAGEANQVGGDFYDLFAVRDGWLLVIGDVTGKGPDAAAITSLARYTIRTAALYETEPVGVVRRLNEALLADAERHQMCTAACLHIVPREDGGFVADLVCAGHPPPYLLRGPGDIEELCRPGPLLGAFSRAEWQPARLELEPGESVVLYTDGVTDARGEQERFGQERLEALLRKAAGGEADDIAEMVDEALRRFEHGPQRDDVALLVLQAAQALEVGETSLVAGSSMSGG